MLKYIILEFLFSYKKKLVTEINLNIFRMKSVFFISQIRFKGILIFSSQYDQFYLKFNYVNKFVFRLFLNAWL